MTQLGWLRLATTPNVLAKKPLTLRRAWERYDRLFNDPRVVFSEEPTELETYWRDGSNRRSVSPKVWNNAFLAALAQAADYQLVSFDQALKQYKRVSWAVLS